MNDFAFMARSVDRSRATPETPEELAGFLAIHGPAAATVCAPLSRTAPKAARTVRGIGVHSVLRSQAIEHQIDRVELPGRWQRDRRWPDDRDERRLILHLRNAAVQIRLPNTRTGVPDWPDRPWLE
jgi:hypothetical protein